MADDNISVGSDSAVSFRASPASHATVSNAGPSTVYYKAEANVNSEDTALTKGSSVTFTEGVHWFKCGQNNSARLFVSYSPEATTDMATQAELDAVSAKALPGLNVKLYGAKGDGSTDDSTAIQAALNAAAAAGEEAVYFPAGYYVVSPLSFPAGVRLVGSGWASTVIKAKNGSVGIAVLEGANYATTGTKNGAVEHLTVDGNKANTESVTGIKLQAQNFYFRNVIVRECDGHGFSVKLTTETESHSFGLENALFSCRAIGCEGRGFNLEAHDTLLFDCQAIQCKEVGFYWNTNGYMIQCHSWCYDSTLESATKTGYRLATSVHCIDCIAEGATERQVEIAGNVVGWSGGEVFNGASKPNAALFEFNGGTSARILDPWCHEFGTGGAFKFTTNGQASIIRAQCFDSGGNQVTNGTPHEEIFWDLSLGGTTTLGEAALTKRKQVSFFAYEPASVPKNTLYVDGADGVLKTKDSTGAVRIVGTPSVEEVVSANTINASKRISVIKLTGVTELIKINPTYAGHVIQIFFTAATKVKSSSENLELAHTMEATSESVLTLWCDGTKWFEVSRQESPNGGTVASANTVTIPNRSKLVKISGTTEVKKINVTFTGHAITLVFTGTAKLVDGENLKLAGNFEGAADRTISLTCDGTNWYETGRSTN